MTDFKTDRDSVVSAIHRAKIGISQYLEIMELFYRVNVAADRDFQRKYNYFYRVRQRSKDFYLIYFDYMEKVKTKRPTFADVISYLHSKLGRCEPSFSSKLVATIDPNQPIWDAFILKNLGITPPPWGKKDRINKIIDIYHDIHQWYIDRLSTENGHLIISTFNALVDESPRISDIKKIDFVLWQTRKLILNNLWF